jgi:zinc/manganese transport system substrate-binding protein
MRVSLNRPSCSPRRGSRVGPTAAALALGTLLAACGTAGAAVSGSGGGTVPVAAAENFWGSIAKQIGGSHVGVVSIITNPDTDPHSYEPTPADARTLASAGYVIENGAGYDPWVEKLVSANPVSGRRLLDVAHLNGVAEGGNPHMWYSPSDVLRVADRIAADLARIDSADAGYFEAQRRSFESSGLQEYNELRASIRSRYSGVPVAASESIFAYLADDLHLDLLTPPDFMKAISEGTDPTAQDKQTFDQQVTRRLVKVFVYNRQNSVPDVEAVRQKAQAEGIPVVAITETLDPASARFQDWQVAQLRALAQALGQATGR